MFSEIPAEELIPFAGAIVFLVALVREQFPAIDGRFAVAATFLAGPLILTGAWVLDMAPAQVLDLQDAARAGIAAAVLANGGYAMVRSVVPPKGPTRRPLPPPTPRPPGRDYA